jgi:vacuolar-type H+-ATPase subunit H
MEREVPSEGGSDPSVEDLIGSTSERVQSVLDAAERAAAGIIEDAEAEAERHLAEARARAEQLVRERSRLAGALTDDLLERAAVIKEQSDQLIAALQRAIEILEAELGTDAEAEAGTAAAEQGAPDREAALAASRSAEGSSGRAGLTAVPSSDAAGPTADRSQSSSTAVPGGAESPTAARLLATQMAVAGASREEIEHRLRAEFGIEDPAKILDVAIGAANSEPERHG